MDKQEIFEQLKSGLQNKSNFDAYLSQPIEFDGRQWTAGQFLYKYYFDEIQPFNIAATQGKIAKEDEPIAAKLKDIAEKGLISPVKVHDLMKKGQVPDVDVFDGDKGKEAFYQNLFCGNRSSADNKCYWTPVSQYYTRFIEHRLTQMGMNQEQIKALMIHCEGEREKAEALAIQNMPEQFIHNSKCSPDKMDGGVIQVKPRCDDNFLNLQNYCFFAKEDTFHSGLPIQGQTQSMSWPRFSPNIIAFRLTPEEAQQSFQDSYNYKVDMSQKDSFKPVIPLWGGKPQEWVATQNLSYHPDVEKEAVNDLIAKGKEFYLIPNKDDWEQLIAGKDNLSEQETRTYMAELSNRYPDKVMKMGPDFMKKYEDEKSVSHLGMQGILAKSATARISCQQPVKKEIPKGVMQRLVAGHE